MEIVKYQPSDRTFLNQLLVKTAAGSQQLGYPRLHSYEELEKEYMEYPDSSILSSVYILTHNDKPIGVMGFLRDGNYAVLWGPVTLESIDYETAIRLSVSFAKKVIPKEFHVFVHDSNTVYSTVLEQLNGRLRSIQHVMCFDWSKGKLLPLGCKNIICLSSKQLADSQKLLGCTADLLKEAFPDLDNANDLIAELLHSKCNFLFYISNGTALGVLIENKNFIHEVRIEYLAVLKKHRRLEIATKMLHYLLQQVYSTYGPCNVNLTHDHENLVAHSVYLKNGFVDDTVYKEFVISC